MNTKHFTTALSLAAAFSASLAFADTQEQVYGATFESTANGVTNDFGYTVGNYLKDGDYNNNGSYGWFAGDDDNSVIVADEGYDGSAALKLDTEGNTLSNVLSQAGVAATLNNTIADGNSVVFESQIKFVTTDSTGATGIDLNSDADAKFAIYAIKTDEDTDAHLVVYHTYQDEYAQWQSEEEVFEDAVIDTDDYTAVKVVLFKDENYANNKLLFRVYVNGTVVESQYPVVDGEEDMTLMATLNDENVSSSANLSAICLKGTGNIDNIAVSTLVEDEEEEDWVDSSTIEEGATAAETYAALAGTALANADAQALTDWAAANNVAYADVTGAPADYLDAFLLNCAVADVEAEKAEFVLNITIENGEVQVSGPDGKTYNVEIRIDGKADLSDEWTQDVGSSLGSYNFFKGVLAL